jgi:hypothetical protein
MIRLRHRETLPIPTDTIPWRVVRSQPRLHLAARDVVACSAHRRPRALKVTPRPHPSQSGLRSCQQPQGPFPRATILASRAENTVPAFAPRTCAPSIVDATHRAIGAFAAASASRANAAHASARVLPRRASVTPISVAVVARMILSTPRAARMLACNVDFTAQR